MSSNKEQPKSVRRNEQEGSGQMANRVSGHANAGVGGQQAMDGGGQQMDELPLESSPYVKYSNLEDYKRQAYGTDGQHLEPVNNQRGGGATEGPTLSGSGLSQAQAKAMAMAMDQANRSGIP
ncbi:uncharacterized protein LOC110007760 [Amborella trichopoda]|uniref:Uncharacterized protein n=1 Tax=Amborella trichopoda TaxID=13333 RepID=W1PUP0_AMBTC|nr:uncharacterized protein LOC110007760 [Amborella trichopoda]ERN11773.1 hypothetical protein AMTR_s00022p00247940 [Amborella trichopoda]|eukprot:XP_020526499.1 uncharacterized protein LOC110007760 [Amborella trichopoda]